MLKDKWRSSIIKENLWYHKIKIDKLKSWCYNQIRTNVREIFSKIGIDYFNLFC